LEFAGYGLQLEYDGYEKPIEAEKKYRYNIGYGPVETLDGHISGKTLLALSASELTDPQVLSEAKTLMRKVIDVYLQGKQLKSRAVISKVIATTQRLEK